MSGQEWCPRCQKFVRVETTKAQVFFDTIETVVCCECHGMIRQVVK